MLNTTIRFFDLDIDSDSIRFDALIGIGNIVGLGPISIFDIDSVINGYTFNTNIPDLDAARLSFSADSFSINFDGLSTSSAQYLDITLQTSSVPEPTSLASPGLGLAGLGFARKKKAA